MFTTKLSRAAPRAATAALSPTSSTAASTAQQATRCLATGAGGRPSHQRRHSSSKASTPPDSAASGGGKAAAVGAKGKGNGNAEGASTAQPVQSTQSSQSAPAEKKKTGYRRAGAVTAAGKAKGKESTGVDQFAGLPSVPSLQGLENPEVQKDLSMSSFFSLHRPISLTQPFPPTVTPQTFSAIFSTARDRQDPWHNGNSAERRPEDIIITLNNTIEMLEGNRDQAENEGVRWEVLNEQEGASGGVKHLDGTPQQPRIKSLDELVANFRPFRAPPPPEPFDEKYARPSSSGQKQKKVASTSTATKKGREPQQKIYVTEIRVTESTHSDGRKTYAASSTPIRRLEEQQQQSSSSTSSSASASASTASRQVFLERVRRRTEKGIRAEMASIRKPLRVKVLQGMGWRRRETWWTISVKRQRKLKMKKHKHKKLMKRTRNLRRRLGRT